MRFHEKLAKELKSSKEERKILPRSYNILGDILIIKVDRSLRKKKKKIGNAILDILPYIKSVVVEKSISGVTGTPSWEIPAAPVHILPSAKMTAAETPIAPLLLIDSLSAS